ncbi:peptidoglycan-binding protein [Rhizobiales bacterium]|uniref:peptidoglycan-binding protein n=1 Tax=Hongsoonwoonella zoysiae TaxID=2821844 RepID=UPI001560C4CB|nr:peptidoglycan-binding protein [Hongsoonwoonella zoysiae]NRG16285.1 peptidoglycan-binding protein [Hongsoonwoonella zoysiae]
MRFIPENVSIAAPRALLAFTLLTAGLAWQGPPAFAIDIFDIFRAPPVYVEPAPQRQANPEPNPPARSRPAYDAAQVTRVQSMLNDLGYDAGPVDGFYGPQTRSALAQFQSDYGIAGNGSINRQSISTLTAIWQRSEPQEPQAPEQAATPDRSPPKAPEGETAREAPEDRTQGGQTAQPPRGPSAEPASVKNLSAEEVRQLLINARYRHVRDDGTGGSFFLSPDGTISSHTDGAPVGRMGKFAIRPDGRICWDVSGVKGCFRYYSENGQLRVRREDEESTVELGRVVITGSTLSPGTAAQSSSEPETAQAPARLTRNHISQIQAALSEKGYDAGSADGLIGPKTRSAIAAYEAANGLRVTAEPSPKLYEALILDNTGQAGLRADTAGEDGQAGEKGAAVALTILGKPFRLSLAFAEDEPVLRDPAEIAKHFPKDLEAARDGVSGDDEILAIVEERAWAGQILYWEAFEALLDERMRGVAREDINRSEEDLFIAFQKGQGAEISPKVQMLHDEQLALYLVARGLRGKSGYEEPSGGTDFTMMGLSADVREKFTRQGFDPQESYLNFRRLRAAFRVGDVGLLNWAVAYPVNLIDGGSRRALKNRADLEAAGTDVLNMALREIVLKQTFAEMFVRDQGAMFGNGELWMTPACEEGACQRLGLGTVNVTGIDEREPIPYPGATAADSISAAAGPGTDEPEEHAAKAATGPKEKMKPEPLSFTPAALSDYRYALAPALDGPEGMEHVAIAPFDLDGDGKVELVAKLTGSLWCGTRNCNYQIYDENDGKWELVKPYLSPDCEQTVTTTVRNGRRQIRSCTGSLF